MKNLITLIAFSFFIVFGASAQKSDLKGPAYKNRKPWKDPKPTSTLYVKKGETLKGPEAKNARPLERKQGELVAVNLETKEKPVGPAYKNRKPWSDNSVSEQQFADDSKKDDNEPLVTKN